MVVLCALTCMEGYSLLLLHLKCVFRCSLVIHSGVLSGDKWVLVLSIRSYLENPRTHSSDHSLVMYVRDPRPDPSVVHLQPSAASFFDRWLSGSCLCLPSAFHRS